MEIKVEEFKTYIHNVRLSVAGLYHCCNVWVFNCDDGYEVSSSVFLYHDEELIFEKELKLFFDNSFDAHALAISFANRAVL